MGEVWRPAIRCDSVFKDYIESLSNVTSLDKNQIMRMMIFVSAHSEDFKFVISEYKNEGVTTLPLPLWDPWEDDYWLKQTYAKEKPGVTNKYLDNKEVTIEKGEGGVIKIEVSSLLSRS